MAQISYPPSLNNISDRAIRLALKDAYDNMNKILGTLGPALANVLTRPQGGRSDVTGASLIGALAQPVLGQVNADPILEEIGIQSESVTSITAGTGLDTSPSPLVGAGTISLEDTAVTPGAYSNGDFTVDQQGRIIAASDGTVPHRLSLTVVDIDDTTSQLLYQVPGGKVLIVTGAVARDPSVDISTYLNSVAIIDNSSGENVIDDFTSAQWAFLADSNHYYPNPGHVGANPPYRVVGPGDKVMAKPSLAFGSPATVTIDLFGYFI